MYKRQLLKYRDENPDLNNIAILVRAVFQSREIEESLIRYSIPYRIIGGIRFYERAEIKDAVSYLRLVYESQDDVAFERALMVPKRGIGEKSFNYIIALAKKNKTSLYQASKLLIDTDELTKKISESLKRFIQVIDIGKNMVDNTQFFDILKVLLDESGYMNMLKNDKNVSAQTKIENIKELIVAMEDYNSCLLYTSDAADE